MDVTKKKAGGAISLMTRAKIFLWSLAATPVVLFVAIISTGFGHGDYVWARILLPYTFGYWAFSSGGIPGQLVVLGLLQIPIYGLLLALSPNKYVMIFIGLFILICHAIGIYFCFSASYKIP